MRLSDIVLYNGGRGAEDGNNYWKKVAAPHYVYVTVTLLLISCGLGAAGLALGGADGAGSAGYDFEVILLNTLPCALLIFLLYFSTGRAWIAVTVTGLAVLVCAFLDRRAMDAFGGSFVGMGADRLPDVLGGGLEWRQLLPSAGVLAVAVLLSVFLLRGALRNKPVRLAGAFLTAVLTVALLATVYSSAILYDSLDAGRGAIYRTLYTLMGG